MAPGRNAGGLLVFAIVFALRHGALAKSRIVWYNSGRNFCGENAALRGGRDGKMAENDVVGTGGMASEPGEWKVYFGDSFWGVHRGQGRAGAERPLGKRFVWGGRNFLVPAVYACDEGLVLDCCMEVPAEELRAFCEKWGLSPEHDGSDFDDEKLARVEAENTLDVDIQAELCLNGEQLSSENCCATSWNPCFPEGNGKEMREVVRHYALDPGCGWRVWRYTFPCRAAQKAAPDTLSLTLRRELAETEGPRFHVSAAGEQIELVNPASDARYILTVQACEPQQESGKAFENPVYSFPTHSVAMAYTLTPTLEDEVFEVRDAHQGDRPRRKDGQADKPGNSSMVMGLLRRIRQGTLREARSSLRFQPVAIGDIEWKPVFRAKPWADTTVELLERGRRTNF